MASAPEHSARFCSIVNESPRSSVGDHPVARYVAIMRSRDLTTAQAEALMKQVGRRLRYLGRLCERMNQRGFPPNDELFKAATKAYEALHELHVKCHYAGCKEGVGKASEDTT